MITRLANGARALLVVLGSGFLGAVYLWYLEAEPFPPDLLRLVPVAWLAGSLAGALMAVRAIRGDRHRLAAGIALLSSLPNIVLAVLFTIGALMGD